MNRPGPSELLIVKWVFCISCIERRGGGACAALCSIRSEFLEQLSNTRSAVTPTQENGERHTFLVASPLSYREVLSHPPFTLKPLYPKATFTSCKNCCRFVFTH